MNRLPLLAGHSLDSIIAYRKGVAVSTGRFIAQAQVLAADLPSRPTVINLCEDRYSFLLGFAAAMLRGQTTLLPPNRAPQTIRQLLERYEQSYPLSDEANEYDEFPTVPCQVTETLPEAEAIPQIDADLVCAILYTSGSSGKAVPHPKSWQTLVEGAQLSGQQLAIRKGTTLLATVPPQHMFGLETTVLLPLQYGCAIDNRCPLFPADIAAALESLPQRRALITTPLQLHACASMRQALPGCDFILSATAPLSAELAAEIETLCGTTVKEIYGSTETGAIATRHSAHEQRWQPLPGVTLEQQGEQWRVSANHLPNSQALGDRLQREDPGFLLLGRSSDLVKVAGKRVSLGELNHILCTINGVRDGAFFLPQESDDRITTRLAAVAVSDTLDEASLLDTLRQRIDAAFLPRPLLLVEALPRNETGKLPQQQLLRPYVEIPR